MKEKILLFIPMYNCEKQITRVLKQLNEEVQEYINEIIVVNNISTDSGEEKVKEYIKDNEFKCKITLMRNCENYGLGGSHKVAFKYAKENGFDTISTTLLVSPYQNHEALIEVAKFMAKKYEVEFLYRDFRVGFREGQNKARELGLYMQKYCGCIFSEEDRYLKKIEKDKKKKLEVLDVRK